MTDEPGSAMVQFGDHAPFPTGRTRDVAVGTHEVEFVWPNGERVVTSVRIERDGQEVSARRPDLAGLPRRSNR